MIRKVVALLPEGKLFDWVFAEAMAPAVAEVGGSIVRQRLDLWNEIDRSALGHALKSAELVLADLTGNNAHVMYAVGWTQALGTRLLVVAHHLEDLPFAREGQEAIGYAGDRQFLKAELSAYLTADQTRPGESAKEKFLALFGDIMAKHGFEHRNEIKMENASTFVLLDQAMELALVQDLSRRARELGIRLKLM